ncbi:fumarylacetoacetate hydrolase family protein [Blastococcus xanthinilyticus]|uniref:2-keto-4-pentenoate hydratase/2-oxohepta-3-ene-1,7-dioic acid hydratase in catechol pathway n=1 Tax=Blastococcus xanthinilyticus TaxID=1564164 RepID=A0A5S5CYY4_9ACTN|nr:fumarylacetoacetate hydrolase family protein [Blastococcus xanthinilyticus]TYP88971.1 2-keto-4-pentenoate hydratase/2-oxohepta-3-ene-1,7-dioic acid hydratase in catechol pathway [Blastococcus xanthinilyticus]
MRLVSFHGTDGLRLGVETGAGIADVTEAAGDGGPASVRALAGGGAEALERVRRAADSASDVVRLDQLRLAPAVPDAGKIICVGLNYRKHAAEGGMPVPDRPIYFAKYANSLAASGEPVVIPAVTAKADYEVELVAVIGQRARNVDEDRALEHVFGYATGNDLSVRELQMRSSQWMYGKAIDGFAPLGPYVVTSDEVPDPQALDLETRVNGELRQNSNTRDMVFSVAELVSDLSRIMTLEPGDVIYTGTPEGVILGMADQVWLQPGDEVVCEIQGLGRLVTPLVADPG